MKCCHAASLGTSSSTTDHKSKRMGQDDCQLLCFVHSLTLCGITDILFRIVIFVRRSGITCISNARKPLIGNVLARRRRCGPLSLVLVCAISILTRCILLLFFSVAYMLF